MNNGQIELRDFFAGQIVSGYTERILMTSPSNTEYYAKQAYVLADALIKARSQKNEDKQNPNDDAVRLCADLVAWNDVRNLSLGKAYDSLISRARSISIK